MNTPSPVAPVRDAIPLRPAGHRGPLRAMAGLVLAAALLTISLLSAGVAHAATEARRRRLSRLGADGRLGHVRAGDHHQPERAGHAGRPGTGHTRKQCGGRGLTQRGQGPHGERLRGPGASEHR